MSLYVIPIITQVEQLKGATVRRLRLTSSGAYILKVGLKRAGLEAIKDVTLIQAGGVPESFAALPRRQGPGGDASAAHDLQG